MNNIKLHSISRVKVNLYLHVIGKRKDGYHNLDSLVAFPNIGDKIEIYLNESGSPALIKDPSDFDSIYVVMPMKG